MGKNSLRVEWKARPSELGAPPLPQMEALNRVWISRVYVITTPSRAGYAQKLEIAG
jgi:hypothetical protein